MINKTSILFLSFFSFFILNSQNLKSADDCIPKKPNPSRLVNDFAEVLSASAENQIESALVNFNDTTSTQIAVVTVKDLCDYDAFTFSYEIGEKWGVGSKDFNNGIVVLVKPKYTSSKGEVYIQVGYGLEGVLPDAIAKRIVEKEMIPYFKQEDYQSGIVSAVKVIMEITGGEYSAKDYNKKKGKKSIPLVPFFVVLFFIFLMLSRTFGRARTYSRRNNVGLWTALWLMGSMNGSHRGRYHDFTNGGGGFGGFGGGSGGGFGGFGGGSFGGGGAGGSW